MVNKGIEGIVWAEDIMASPGCLQVGHGNHPVTKLPSINIEKNGQRLEILPLSNMGMATTSLCFQHSHPSHIISKAENPTTPHVTNWNATDH